MMDSVEEVFVYGAGGHAKVVIDILEKQGKYIIGYLVDDHPDLKGEIFYDYQVVGDLESLSLVKANLKSTVVAIGDNGRRSSIASFLKEKGYCLITAFHPSCQLGRGSIVGEGTVVMACTVINSDSRIGDNVIVNTKASIDHDCIIGNGVHIAPGAVLCGSVRVGDCTTIGAGATVLANLTIGKSVMVGAGSVVIEDIPDYCTVAGVPARVLPH